MSSFNQQGKNHMYLELRVGGTPTWDGATSIAQLAERAGISGLMFPETSQAPWMTMAFAGRATERLQLSTGVATAFTRSPMVTACEAWEMARNTRGRFRLGLGSQVKAHVERRYGAEFDPPGPRLRDYVKAVKACFGAFRQEEPLRHEGPYYGLTLLPEDWTPKPHPYGDIKVDISAVNQWMCKMAGEVADGIHVHPLHSGDYLHSRLLPAVSDGAETSGRRMNDIELSVLAFIVPGDTPEEREPLLNRVRYQIAFYGSTKNYAFQFDDLGFEGTSARLNNLFKSGDLEGMAATITDEILDHFAVVGRWDEIADRLVERYRPMATGWSLTTLPKP